MYGPIPKDEQGRSFDIHHINGNHADNRLENLKCVSIQEHYDIHLKQCDWGACTLIANRLNMSAEEISELASRLAKANVKQRVESGTHNWLKNNIKKKECPWCQRSFPPTPYSLFHGDYCLSNPNAMPRKPLKKKECQWCHGSFAPGPYGKFHGKYCLSNPDALPRKTRKPHEKKECPWCHGSFSPTPYSKFHGKYCLSNPDALPRKTKK